MLVFFALISILIGLAAVIGLAAMFFWHKSQPVTFATVFLGYFYTVSIISLLAVFCGGALAGKAWLSDGFGRSFSYQSYAAAPPMAPAPAQSTQEAVLAIKSQQDNLQQDQVRIESDYRDDLYTGISMAVVGLLFLIVHVIGWRSLANQDKKVSAALFKTYNFTQLAMYSLAALVSLPLAISQILRYNLPVATDTNLTAPGTALALATLAVPLWLFFAYRTIKLAKSSS